MLNNDIKRLEMKYVFFQKGKFLSERKGKFEIMLIYVNILVHSVLKGTVKIRFGDTVISKRGKYL